MWPFGHDHVVQRLAAIPPGTTGAVAARVTVVSESSVVSPLSGLASAFLQVDLLERLIDEYVVLGSVKYGQVLRLRDCDGDEVSVVAAAVRFEPSTLLGGQPVTDILPELAPYLRNATGRGILCSREHALRTGDAVLLKAVVEPSRTRYLVRDDLAPVVLAEVVDVPVW